jgi:dTDP-4-dehydrorhamnose 3,5-epimerase
VLRIADVKLLSSVAQTNVSYTYTRGTLRGLHRQAPPYAEAKPVP